MGLTDRRGIGPPATYVHAASALPTTPPTMGWASTLFPRSDVVFLVYNPLGQGAGGTAEGAENFLGSQLSTVGDGGNQEGERTLGGDWATEGMDGTAVRREAILTEPDCGSLIQIRSS